MNNSITKITIRIEKCHHSATSQKNHPTSPCFPLLTKERDERERLKEA